MRSAKQAGGTSSKVSRDPIRRAIKACVERLEDRLLLSATSAQSETFVARSPIAALAASFASESQAAPSLAALNAPQVYSSGGTAYVFSATFADPAGIDLSSLSGTNVRIEGTNGFNQPAALAAVSASPDGTQATATYRMTAPGGTWDPSDSALYSIVVQAGQIRDVGGGAMPAGPIGSFSAQIAGIPFQPDLSPASDSGVSSHDKITNLNNASAAAELQFTIDNTLPGALVSLYCDGISVGSAAASSTITAITTDGKTALSDGAHVITARQLGLDGKNTADSAALTITIDTSAPAVPPGPTLDAASDSGASNSDRITRVITPVLDVAAAPYHLVYRDGVLVSGAADSGTTYTSPALPDGTYQFTVSSVDAAGNVSAPSAPAAVIIGTSAPAVEANLAPLLVPGAAIYTFTVTFNSAVPVDASSLGSGNFLVTNSTGYDQPAALVSVADNANGSPQSATYSAPAPGGFWSEASDGTFTVSLQGGQVRDLAGNYAAAGVLGTFQVAADGLGPPDLQPTTDSGSSRSDDVTNFNNSTLGKALAFRVTNVPVGSKISLYSDGTLIGSGIAVLTTMYMGTDGSTVLADGVHSITVRVTPPGGSQSPDSPALRVTIDTTPPPAPPAPVLDPGSDGGIKGDDVTNVNTPALDVTASEPGIVHLAADATEWTGSAAAAAPGAYKISQPVPPNGFASPQAYAVNTGGFATTATADLNGDGISDLVTSNDANGNTSVLLGQAGGVFRIASTFAIYDAPQRIALTDVNNDGKPDLIAASGYGIFDVYLGNGNGGFLLSGKVQIGAIQTFVVADVNHDGNPDLLVGTFNGNESLCLGNGDGTFGSPSPFAEGAFPHALFPIDLNGDGIPDVLTSGLNDLPQLLANGDGSYLSPAYSSPPFLKFLADLDGDGKPDVLSPDTTNGPPAELNVQWDGSGPVTGIAVPYASEGLVVGDFNRDGKLDFATTYPVGTQYFWAIFYGAGNHSFQPPVSLPLAAQRMTSFAAGDFNGDGRLDLAAVTSNQYAPSADVELTLGTGGPLMDGVYSFHAWTEDVAGNLSPDSPDATITIDTHRPTAQLQAGDLTIEGTPAYNFTVTYSDPNGIDVSTIGNSNIAVTGPDGFIAAATATAVNPNADGSLVAVSYEITPQGGQRSLSDNGTYTILMQAAQVSDLAGNTIPAGPLGSFRVSVAPVPRVPVLAAATDSGISSMDGITAFNNSSPARALQFTVTSTVPGAVVTVYADGIAIGSTVASGGTTAITTDGTTAFTDGIHQITARQQAPLAAQTADSAALALTIDTTAPAAPPAPILDPSSDSGISTSDGITNRFTPTLDVSATPYFRVYLGGARVSGSYASGTQFTSAILPNATYEFQVSAVDAAGNESPLSAPTTITIATAPPRVTPASVPEVMSAGGNTYTFSLTFSDLAGIVTAGVGGGSITVTGPQAFSQNATLLSIDDAANGSPRTATYQITAPGGRWLSTADGTYTVQLNAGQVSDVAGNVAPAQIAGTFNVAADNLATPDLLPANDSGISNTDNITNFNNTSSSRAMQFVVGNTHAGSTVSLFSDGTLIGAANGVAGTTGVTTDGLTTIADGTHAITAREVLQDGTVLPDSQPLAVTIDTVAPTLSTVLERSSDSGVSNTDGITNVASPMFGATTSEAGTIYLQGSGLDGEVTFNASAAGTYPIQFLPAPGIQLSGTYPSSIGLLSVYVVDVNSDHVPDLVTFGYDPAAPVSATFRLSVYLGKGDGTFILKQTLMVGAELNLNFADLNADRKLDILLVDSPNPRSLTELLGNGDGTFQVGPNIGTGGYTTSVAVADMNGDGKPDIVAFNEELDSAPPNTPSRNVSVLLGNGDGSFQPPLVFSSTMPQAPAVTIADLNGDGVPDVVLSDIALSGIQVYFGVGDGSLQFKGTYNLDAGPWEIVPVDLNHDGKTDLIAAESSSGNVQVLLSRGDGTFSSSTLTNIGGLAIADANGDGNPDLISSSSINNVHYLRIFTGQGDGSFQQTQSSVLPGFASLEGATDLNHDGHLDFVFMNGDARGVSAYLGTGGSLTDGSHSIEAWAEDAAGNRSAFLTTSITVDTTPPKATLNAPNITAATANPYQFTVTYSDATAVRASSIGDGGVIVTDPNGFTAAATLVSVDSASDGPSLTATYQIPAPPGGWTAAANGTYTISLQPGAISDVAGNLAPGRSLGTFVITIASAAPAARVAPLASRRVRRVALPPTSTTALLSASDAATPPPPTAPPAAPMSVSASQSASAPGMLLKDINPDTASTSFMQIAAVNGTGYFTTIARAGGYALWKTDGTPADTLQLMTFTGSAPALMGSIGNVELFNTGRALWRSDGTPEGTYQIKAMRVTGGGVTLNNLMLFDGYDPSSSTGYQLWRTDGTAAGTQLLQHTTSDAGASPIFLTNVFGTVFFSDWDYMGIGGLWATDGTVAGTVLVKSFGTSAIPTSLTNVGGTLLFDLTGTTNSSALWSSDGTAAGTVMLKDLSSDRLDGGIGQVAVVDGRLYFGTVSGALWTSDGTADGTFSLGAGLNPTDLTGLGNELYFISGGGQLWKSDGTPGGTAQVAVVPQMSNLTAFGNQLLFDATDPAHGQELWTSDGTAAGTALLKDINPGPAASMPTALTPAGHQLFFRADDGLHGAELWKTDGTTAGTVLVDDTNTTPMSSSPRSFVSFDHNAFFIALGPQGYGLYKSDGTADGTVFVASTASWVAALPGGVYFQAGNILYRSDGNAGNAAPVASIGYNANYVATANGVLFFTTSGSSGMQLWRSDGTAAGTYTLALTSGTTGLLNVTAADHFLFFYAYSGGPSVSAWVSDGSTAGTFMLNGTSNAVPWDGSALPAFAYATGTMVVFVNHHGVWRTDGSNLGSYQLTDPTTGQAIWAANVTPQGAELGGTAYALSDEGSNGIYLLRTDGIGAGTSLIPLPPSYADRLVATNERLFFWVLPLNSKEYDLWTSDGTAAGTVFVKAFGYASGGPYPSDPTAVGQFVYFTASLSAGSPYVLWRSDGTPAGTVSLPPGSTIPSPMAGVTVDGSFFYAGTDAAHGTELWIEPSAQIPAPPAAPSGLTATPVGQGQVNLTFTDNAANDSSLRIERSTDPNFTTIDKVIVLVPGTSEYLDSGAVAAPIYYYRTYAANIGGNSADSTAASAAFGSLSGSVFQDANDDGIQEGGEGNLVGVQVYLDLNGNGILDPAEPATITNANGTYTFDNIAPGSYGVRQVLPSGFGQTTPQAPTGPATVAALRETAGPIFGDVPISSVTLDLDYLLVLTRNFGKPGVFGTGDLNGDGMVNLADFLLLSRNFGHALPAAVVDPPAMVAGVIPSAPLTARLAVRRR